MAEYKWISAECPICLEEFTNNRPAYLFDCGHGCCSDCTQRLRNQFRPLCPICRDYLKVIDKRIVRIRRAINHSDGATLFELIMCESLSITSLNDKPQYVSEFISRYECAKEREFTQETVKQLLQRRNQCIQKEFKKHARHISDGRFDLTIRGYVRATSQLKEEYARRVLTTQLIDIDLAYNCTPFLIVPEAGLNATYINWNIFSAKKHFDTFCKLALIDVRSLAAIHRSDLDDDEYVRLIDAASKTNLIRTFNETCFDRIPTEKRYALWMKMLKRELYTPQYLQRIAKNSAEAMRFYHMAVENDPRNLKWPSRMVREEDYIEIAVDVIKQNPFAMRFLNNPWKFKARIANELDRLLLQ